MYVAVVQCNPVVGALQQNCERALSQVEELAQLSDPPALVVFPAFALSGTPLGGLSTHTAFSRECVEVARRFCSEARLPTLIGTVLPSFKPNAQTTKNLWPARDAQATESPLLVSNVQALENPWPVSDPSPQPPSPVFPYCYPEVLLAQGNRSRALGFNTPLTDGRLQPQPGVRLDINGHRLTVLFNRVVCEADYDQSEALIMMLALPCQGAKTLLTSTDRLCADARARACALVVADLCGAADSTVFAGGSLIISSAGTLRAAASLFNEEILCASLSGNANASPDRDIDARALDGDVDACEPARKSAPLNQLQQSQLVKQQPTSSRKQANEQPARTIMPPEEQWAALCLAISDYLHKNAFTDVALGISGGIDSAVVATLASDALGPEHVHGLLMPSPHSSASSLRDAEQLAANLGISTQIFALDELFTTFGQQFLRLVGTRGSDLAIQNLQARLRTVVLMYFSNSFNWLLLNTGNKSEAAMGYSTLYGDTAGIMAPLGNVYKTGVYALARWRNSTGEVIPASVLAKPPSAELYPGQRDTDSLPDYELLDTILQMHVEENKGASDIVTSCGNQAPEGLGDVAMVTDVLHRVQAAEFKRRQEPWAPKLDGVDFTAQRNWPITNGFVDKARPYLDSGTVLRRLQELYRPLNTDMPPGKPNVPNTDISPNPSLEAN
ncbi:MAG: NAD(+) synthase [Coriobacteriales bacterium]|jgi:NAD+ synthase (glutamine-hydrolysing)|nr:NAD(+) synthase [Coriobacteriales bacterium]